VCGKAKLNCEQIGNLLGCSKPTAYNILETGLLKLKNKKREGVEWELR
jgi:hypothetical protein